MKKNLPYITAVLCCCGLAMAGLSLASNCAGLFFMPVAQSLGVNLGEVSLYLTINNLVMGFAAAPAVKLCRKYDMRRVLGVCVVLSFGTYFFMSRVTATWQLYLLAGLNGGLNAFYGMAMISVVIGNWFFKSMGLASGVAFSFSGLASSFLTMVLSWVIQNHGWRQAYMLNAFLVVASVLPAILFLHFAPEMAGLAPYGGTKPEGKQTAKEQQTGKVALFPVLCVIVLCASFVCGMCTQFSGVGTSVGMNATVAAMMVSATMVGNTISKLCMGVLCDKLGARYAMFIILGTTAAGLAAIFAFAGLGSAVVLLPAALCAGMAFSICGVGMSNLAKEVYGAAAFSAMYPSLSLYVCIGGAVAHTIIGFSFDIFGSYYPALGVCAALCLLCMAAVQFIYKRENKI